MEEHLSGVYADPMDAPNFYLIDHISGIFILYKVSHQDNERGTLSHDLLAGHC